MGTICLDAVWSLKQSQPLAGVREAFTELKRVGVEVAVSAGPHLTNPEDSETARPSRPLRESMQASGLAIKHVDPEKISSGLYVNPRGLWFQGDWEATAVEAVESQLNGTPHSQKYAPPDDSVSGGVTMP